jgi:oxygen-independent coproporphyrinogen-3 oxidase
VSLGGDLTATSRHRGPEAWADLVERTGTGQTHTETLAPRERGREALLMGLRLAEGISLPRFAARTGLALDDAIDLTVQRDLIAAGFLVRDEQRLAATAEGRRRLDALLPALVL